MRIQSLTPSLFWAHSDEILSAARDSIDDVIGHILATAAADPAHSFAALSLSPSAPAPTSLRSTPLYITYAAPTSSNSPSTDVLEIRITATRSPPPATSDLHRPTHLYPRTGKQGYAPFFSELSGTIELVESKLREEKQVVVVVEAVGAGESQSEANDLGSALIVAVLGEYQLPYPVQLRLSDTPANCANLPLQSVASTTTPSCATPQAMGW